MKTNTVTAIFVAGIALSSLMPAQANVVAEWNALAANCTNVNRPGPVQLLDLAIVQAAVHNAVQAIERRYESYLEPVAADGDESKAAAAVSAAYNVLAVICPGQVATTLFPAFKPWSDGDDPGIAVGAAAAQAMLAEYRPTPVLPPFIGGPGIGEWEPQAPASQMAFLYFATTEPFTINSPSQFRPAPPPAMTSRTYLRDYNEVKQFGDVNFHTAGSECPAPRKTELARFWSGNFGLQWNDVLRQIAIDAQLDLGETARLLALGNLAGADAGISVWDSKLYYNFWRPIAAIRRGDDDPNNKTEGDPEWTPFIQSGNFPSGSQTPPYPDYTSGANGLSAAFVTILQKYFRTDWYPFEIYKQTSPVVSICTNPRTYRRFSDAAQEVVDARIYLGIHFRFADEEARRLGARVAHWTFTKALRPLHGGWHDDKDD